MQSIDIEDVELYNSIKKLQQNGCAFQYLDNKQYNGRLLSINNKKLINFANCCYLGLEKHPMLIKAAIKSIEKFGTQNSTSRGLFSSSLYAEIEVLLKKIFSGFPVVYASTTLAHYSALPTLVGERDAIILDGYVHNSIRMASEVCKANGTFVLISKHNDFEHLRYLIKRLKKEGYKKIWYCADGVYSFHGDFCNIPELHKLLDEEENFYAYVDDAHGIGWCGKHGSGYVIGNYGLHEKMIVIGSLSKSIAASGGFLIVPDKKVADILTLTAHSLIFSIPMAPAALGTVVASLKLHISNEIIQYQNELAELIQYFKLKSQEYELPFYTKDFSPIQLLRIDSNHHVINAQKNLINKGFLSSTAAFPAVKKGEEGLRISITRHITKKDIDRYLKAIKDEIKIENKTPKIYVTQ